MKLYQNIILILSPTQNSPTGSAPKVESYLQSVLPTYDTPAIPAQYIYINPCVPIQSVNVWLYHVACCMTTAVL